MITLKLAVTTRILYDHQIFQAQTYGGISRYFVELICGMAGKRDVEPSVFMGFFVNQYGLEKSKDKFKYFWGLPRPRFRDSHLIFNRLNRLALPVFFGIVRPTIYHQTYYAKGNPLFQGRRVVTVYDMIHELFPQDFASIDDTSQRKRAAVTSATKIIAISHSTKSDLVKIFGVNPEKIQVIYLANSLHAPASDRRPLDNAYFLFVGRREGYKNFVTALQALNQYLEQAPATTQLVAFGGGDFTAGETAEIAALGLTGKVIYREGPDTVMATYYRHAAALIYPSLYEGFGIPPLEAMANHCPVITTHLSSIPEVVGEAALYFAPKNPAALAEAMKEVLRPETRSALIRQGLIQEKKFTWDRCIEETYQLYKSL